MTIRTGSLLLLCCAPFTFAERGLIDNNGLFVRAGAGFAPIYVEEVVVDTVLASGATVTAFHSSVHAGSVFNDFYAVYAMAEHNWYIDSEQRIYNTGLVGLGGTYFIPELYGLYLNAGAGLATKVIFGADASASGFGLQLGVGRPLTDHIVLDVNYNYLSLSSVANPAANGDIETISSVQFTFSYQWY